MGKKDKIENRKIEITGLRRFMRRPIMTNNFFISNNAPQNKHCSMTVRYKCAPLLSSCIHIFLISLSGKHWSARR